MYVKSLFSILIPIRLFYKVLDSLIKKINRKLTAWIQYSDKVHVFKKLNEFFIYATYGERNLLVIHNHVSKSLSSRLVVISLSV